ncbi:PhpK family radical SAM P-methyltransferase [Actinophytocola xanthii]|uniref:PhpK family radical SAM P-methyltransferase n=1 Tax=Actinophytocola xanthii TaxID=1912961 RepID=A0A1Q8CK34_9PSEU|nr:PhpK family radical SAM P-methyltransferase [Actinophytocola xanthii]OLF14720.1 PhpK family radical SAM P-methyltransferase [Actinophytocola xanthii]
MSDLDCVVIGYNEGDFDGYRAMCESAGPRSAEYQIFRKEHLVVDGRPVPWLEAFSLLRNKVTGRSDRYHVGEVANLATLYLANFLSRHGLCAEPVSLFSAELDRLADLLDRRPAVVAITTTFYVNILPVVPIVEFVRAHAPSAHVVVGGPLIDNLCVDGITEVVQDLFFAMSADSYVLESQGEHALVEIVEAVRGRSDLSTVSNVVLCPDGESWQLTRKRPENNDLNQASIDWRSFPAELIGPTAQTRTARSCAFKCSFCDYPSRAGALATASVDTVRKELRAMAELGVRNLVFVDDTFNVPPKRFKEICRMMIEEDLGLSWYSYFRCSNARDEEAFDLAAASGCAGVFLGIESGDPGVLDNMHKLAQDSQYRVGIQRLNERGITTFASIIVGFPGETASTVGNTVEFLNETRPTFWRAQPWWANPRSPVYRNKEVFGIDGAGYHWSHRTMSAEEAASQTDRMFDEVTGSVWLPLYDFDFWSLPYLAGKGVGVDELLPMLRLSQQIMRHRDSGSGDPRQLSELERRFEAAVGAVAPAPPRFRYQVSA